MSESLRCDAIVVGSGAGGAPVAAALAEAGLDVVVLDAGARFETRDFSGEEGEMIARLMTAKRSARTPTSRRSTPCVSIQALSRCSTRCTCLAAPR